jgi:2-polyprenyl-3-methyl-5-hydroxy-6-metoxy-1,4-benzoquinol methylase
MKKELKFEENDIIGSTTLDVISKADKFNKWMYNTIKPYCKGKIIEIGSGIGNISNCFLEDNFEIMLTDIRREYCLKLTEEYNNKSGFLGAEVIDLTDVEFEEKHRKHLGQYDTVFALNVIEHIFDDTLALKNCYKLLNKKGQLIILVPSYQKLFNNFDKELGHYRRYNKESLSRIFIKNEYQIVHKQYFNFIGIFGWYITGNLLKKEAIPEGQMKLYNFLVPFFKVIDKIIFNTAGLSVISVGKKINKYENK